MDRLLYIAMTGARETTLAQNKVANNLANASTTGFKADWAQARAMPVFGDGLPSRAFVMTERPASNLAKGSLITTGRDLDIAIKGDGFLAVRDASGAEAYTRAGELRVSETGVLETQSGQLVLGAGGPIVLPPFEKIQIGADGTISVRPQGAPANALVPVERLRLVNPDPKVMTKGEDGLFRQNDGATAQLNAEVTVTSGALEASNVNAVGELIDMISLARQFEVNVKMMRVAEENDGALEKLIQL